MSNSRSFAKGARSGIPIALGYFTVAFSLGILASEIGLSPLQGFISSIVNHASAGEYAELQAISSKATYIEIALATLIINSRYLLMSASLSQKISSDTSFLKRLILGFGVTDEIFAVCFSEPGNLNPYYGYGAMTVAIPSWATGTAIGIFAGNILPQSVVTALSVALYGMFIAIIVPPAKKNKAILILVLVSFAANFAVTELGIFSEEHESLKIIILTVVLSAVAAAVFPVKEDDEEVTETEVNGNEG